MNTQQSKGGSEIDNDNLEGNKSNNLDCYLRKTCQLYGVGELECTRDKITSKKEINDSESVTSSETSSKEVSLQERLNSQLYVVRETDSGKILWKCPMKDSDTLADHLSKNKKMSYRLPCHAFRSMLLPLAEGDRIPVRDPGWLRCCMRGILFGALQNLVANQGSSDNGAHHRLRFPEHSYCWLDDGDQSSSDEDRWAFYYGVKASAGSDPECWLAFTLLDDMEGEDFFSFLANALLSVRKQMGTSWDHQFGEAICTDNATQSKTQLIDVFKQQEFSLEDDCASTIWIPMRCITEIIHQLDKEASVKLPEKANCVKELFASVNQLVMNIKNSLLLPSSQNEANDEVTPSVCCFTFLQMLMQKYISQKRKQVTLMRLMFETASRPVLTDFYHEKNTNTNNQIGVLQLYQILKTIWPSVTLDETTRVFCESYDALYPPSQWDKPAPGGINFESFLIAAERLSLSFQE